MTELIKRRFSCRNCVAKPIQDTLREKLEAFLSSSVRGPLGMPVRLELLAATEQDHAALRGLGTYGFVKGATGFIAAAVERADKDMEDLGYAAERAILYATDLGLGTCWLGGSFTKSRFAERIALQDEESLPAVVSVGYVADRRRLLDIVARRVVGSDHRLPWEALFYDRAFGAPLSPEQAGAMAVPLEMVRLGPSASNRQPWRIIRDGDLWHLYLRRSPRYSRQALGSGKKGDLQRVDLGIAMCHLELSAGELGLRGTWQVRDPGMALPDAMTEYVVSWSVDT